MNVHIKQFIYLDFDLVNFIIAQTSKGLVSERTLEQDNRETKINGTETEISGGGSVGARKIIIIIDPHLHQGGSHRLID